MFVGDKTLAQFQLALRKFCFRPCGSGREKCSPVMDIWVFPVHSGALQKSSTMTGEEPQIIMCSTSISSVDLEIVIYFKLKNTWTQSCYSLRFANSIILVCILLELFLHTHTPMSLSLYNFVSFSFHKRFSIFPLDNMSWKTFHSQNYSCFPSF